MYRGIVQVINELLTDQSRCKRIESDESVARLFGLPLLMREKGIDKQSADVTVTVGTISQVAKTIEITRVTMIVACRMVKQGE